MGREMNKCLKAFCFALGLFGFILLGFGIFLVAATAVAPYITIGTIVGGLVLLISSCLPNCLKFKKLLCLFLITLALYLIIVGILSIVLAGNLVIGLILIGLGVLALLLATICLVFKLLHCILDNGHNKAKV